ncbi:hypothetical protein IFO70_34775 [Phormidium tenue FACHB-886]|nr:hypothetical protein [Phormidium tenue FACHB-886]
MVAFYTIVFANIFAGITCDADTVCRVERCCIHSKILGESAIVIVSKIVSKNNSFAQFNVLDELDRSRSGAALSRSILSSDGVEEA